MSALEGLKNQIRRWGGSDDDESYSNELESAKEEPVQEVPSRSSSQASNANKIYTYNASTTLHLVVNRPKKLSDTAEIAELYKNKTTVILMLNNTKGYSYPYHRLLRRCKLHNGRRDKENRRYNIRSRTLQR